MKKPNAKKTQNQNTIPSQAMPSHQLPALPIITRQRWSLPPLAVSVGSGGVEVAVLGAGDDVHPGGGFGEFPPLWGRKLEF